MTATTRHPAPTPPGSRDGTPLAELFVGFFRRDVLAFLPHGRFEPLPGPPHPTRTPGGPEFRLVEGPDGGDAVELFGARYALGPRGGGRLSAHDRRMVGAIGAVMTLRYHHMFRIAHPPRLELFRGGSEDHYIAAFVEPAAYAVDSARPSRIAATIQTLRTAALSTYENRRVSTGALLLGAGDGGAGVGARPAPPDALTYGVELTALKSLHRLCDGRRTLFLVDPEGKLAAIVDVARWAGGGPDGDDVPCARAYAAHARATRSGGHVCLVLSPNQEIKLFADGVQSVAFAHGRWRLLDPPAKYAVWRAAVADERVARALFQTALDLAEERQGGLLVVADDPCRAVGRLVAPHDLLTAPDPPCGPPAELTPGDPLAKRALHYLARGRSVTDLDPPVLEALAGLDGALVTDRAGRLLAFGAILRHDPASLSGPVTAEGARTTAALAASHFGPVLKVSEDGLVSCYLHGARAWDL